MNKEDVQVKFDIDYRWLFRGVLAIHNQQTLDEKKTESTNHHNRRGFTPADAKFLSSISEDIKRGYGLSPKQVFVLRKKMRKYAAQCCNLAKAGVRVEDVGRLEDAVKATSVRNDPAFVVGTAQWKQRIAEKSDGRTVVGCMGGFIGFDEDGHMRDL